MEFRADRLLTMMEANQMTVPWVAEKLGVTRQLIYRWIAGKSIPGIQPLCALCDLFAVDMNFFFPSLRQLKGVKPGKPEMALV